MANFVGRWIARSRSRADFTFADWRLFHSEADNQLRPAIRNRLAPAEHKSF